MNGVVFGGERTGEGSLRLLSAGEAYARWLRGAQERLQAEGGEGGRSAGESGDAGDTD